MRWFICSYMACFTICELWVFNPLSNIAISFFVFFKILFSFLFFVKTCYNESKKIFYPQFLLLNCCLCYNRLIVASIEKNLSLYCHNNIFVIEKYIYKNTEKLVANLPNFYTNSSYIWTGDQFYWWLKPVYLYKPIYPLFVTVKFA